MKLLARLVLMGASSVCAFIGLFMVLEGSGLRANNEHEEKEFIRKKEQETNVNGSQILGGVGMLACAALFVAAQLLIPSIKDPWTDQA